VRTGPGGKEAKFLGLIGTSLRDVCTTMTDVDTEERRKPVEVAVAVLVPDVAALAVGDDRDLMVLVGP
jgi:hypothetical protein